MEHEAEVGIQEADDRMMMESVHQPFPSHVQAYDVLRRIGELEDAKQSICLEIDECMGQLASIATHIDEDSLLNRMLAAVFPKVVVPKQRAETSKSAPKRKRTKKKS